MVTVVGQNLATRDLFCVFGEASEVAAETVTSSSLRCRTPASAGGETVDMRVMDAGVEVKRFKGSFRYMGRVEVSRLRPSVGPIAGGLQAIVEGSGLRKELDVNCHFGGAESRGQYIDASAFSCTIPQRREPANVTFSLSVGGIKIEGSEREFSYEDTGAILGMHPRMGPVKGGTDVALTMRDPRRHVDLRCVFDGRKVTPTSVMASTIVCKSPRHRRGEVTVEVWSESGGLSGTGFKYSFTGIAEIFGVTPSVGPVKGGIKVEIVGIEFESSGDMLSPPSCRFGEAVTVASVISTGVMTCVAPASIQSVVALSVSTNARDYSSTSVWFAYAAEIQVFRVVPSSVVQYGSTKVTVHGSDFIDTKEISCRFGAMQVELAEWISSSRLTVTVPRLRTGSHSVEVSLDGAKFSSTSAELEVRKVPVVVAVNPSSSRLSGGKLVEVQTWNVEVDSEVRCIFGSALASATV